MSNEVTDNKATHRNELLRTMKHDGIAEKQPVVQATTALAHTMNIDQELTATEGRKLFKTSANQTRGVLRKGHSLLEEVNDHTPSRRSRSTLGTLEDVANELWRLYRRAERGQIPTADASRLAYMLTSLAKVMEAARQLPPPMAKTITAETMQPIGLGDLYQAIKVLRLDQAEEITHEAQP